MSSLKSFFIRSRQRALPKLYSACILLFSVCPFEKGIQDVKKCPGHFYFVQTAGNIMIIVIGALLLV